MRAWQWLCVAVVLSAVLVGCTKTDLLILNDSGKDTQVMVAGPGKVTPKNESIAVSNSGKGYIEIETPNGDMPATYQWQAGDRKGSFVIDKNSGSMQILQLLPDSAKVVDVSR